MMTVFCKFRVAGFHHWPGAPKKYAYLGVPHRHEFHVTVHHLAQHADREVEFIHLKTAAVDCFIALAQDEEKDPYNHLDFGPQSCEQMCINLKKNLDSIGWKGVTTIEVSEDGENGAVVTFQ